MATSLQQPQPGQKPTPQQVAALRQQLAADAAKQGMSVEQYVNKLKENAQQQHEQQQVQQQKEQEAAAQQQQQQQMPINPGAPDPRGVAVAKFLRSQELKSRTCILNGQRKDMFKGRLTCDIARNSAKLTSYASKTRHPCLSIRRLQESLRKEQTTPKNHRPQDRR